MNCHLRVNEPAIGSSGTIDSLHCSTLQTPRTAAAVMFATVLHQRVLGSFNNARPVKQKSKNSRPIHNYELIDRTIGARKRVH